jgi:two-component system LytT family response regulator
VNADDYIFISDGVKYWLGPVGGIVSLSQGGNYTEFYICNGQKLMVRGTIARWETKLPASIFFRTGRDHVVNLTHVKHMTVADARHLLFVMEGDIEITLSRQQSILFRKQRNLASNCGCNNETLEARTTKRRECTEGQAKRMASQGNKGRQDI